MIEYAMPWGKYQGEQIQDVPRRYLNWLLEQDWIDEHEELVEAIEDQLAVRDRSYSKF
jgi:uncharacterized protein (DUF3820 family)